MKDPSKLPHDTEGNVTLVAMLLLTLVELWGCEHVVFIIRHYLSPKWFAAVREMFSSVYCGKEVLIKTIIRQLGAKFQDTEVFMIGNKHVLCQTVLTDGMLCNI
jgi:hypothetical protein